MSNRYPHQVLSRLTSQTEKDAAEKLAKDNGISVSTMIRFLILQAEREGWQLGIQRKRKVAA
ncbi:MAG: hypothetical protein M3Y08_01365 [Fibrobacterota bacterium]|nr:hypothetical protein [Fibrobacterota bacterium]